MSEAQNQCDDSKLVQDFLLKQKGEVFVDIGANAGFYSLNLSSSFKEVIAYEPGEVSADFLDSQIIKHGINNIIVKRIAITDFVGTIDFFLSENGPKFCSILPVSKNSIKVPCTSLVNEFSNKRIDLIKVDVEGAEFRVVTSALPIMKRIHNWIIEIHDLKEICGNPVSNLEERKREMENLLKSQGYVTRWIDVKTIFASRDARISAIVHTYNSSETIKDCLESLDGKMSRIIVIDGPRWIGVDHPGRNSTDGTIQIVEDFQRGAKSEIILKILSEPMFEFECRSFGLSLIPDGEWILAIDSDEYLAGQIDLSRLIEQGYNLTGVDRSRVCLIRKTPDLRYTTNPHYGLKDKYGNVNLDNFPLLEGIIIHPHEHSSDKKMRSTANKYQIWASQYVIKKSNEENT